MPVFKSPIAYHRTLSSVRKFSSQNGGPPRSLSDGGPLAARLKTRSVIRFRGSDTVKFLQGLLTNDVKAFGAPPKDKTSTLVTSNLPHESTRPIYSALLTPQGRFLYDLFLYRPPPPDHKLDPTGSGPGPHPNDTPTVLADVDAFVLDELLDCFRKYRLRSKVEIENVSGEFSCWQRFGGNLSNEALSKDEPEADSVGWGGAVDGASMSSSQGVNLGWQWFMDPRLECLGFRGIFPSNTTPPMVESDQETDEEFYLQWRIEKGVAEGSTEIPKGEAIPLEYNLVAMNAISFDKGCYVGQELVARTHHSGVIRKRLLPLKFVDESGREVELEVAPGSEVVDAKSDKVGIVTKVLRCRGMGLLRLADAFKDSGVLNIKGQKYGKVKAIRPDWWPAEWVAGHENQSAVA